MAQFTVFLAYALSAMGLTILVVWPENGPGSYVREHLLRRRLPKSAHGMLDCYICFSFWSGLILSVPWWLIYHQNWVWFGCLIIPAVFWWVTGKWK